MLPIGPLMIEHRLIEKMIAVIKKEIDRGEQEKKINPEFIDLAVDFIRIYADRCHHGKEEDILFRELYKKPLSNEQKQIMEELIEEHQQGRMNVADLVEAKGRYLRGDPEALPFMLNRMQFLVDFYPKHIEKEDRHFFLPIMNYFSQAEKEVMLAEEYEFDKNLIHLIYEEKIHQAEETETKEYFEPAEQNKVLVSQFLKGLDGSLSIIDEVCASQFVAHIPGSAQPVAREGFKQFASLFYLAFPDLRHTVEDQVAEGDKVMSRLKVQGTHQGLFQDMAPTGKQVTFTDIMITRIEDGKIMELWAQFDALGLWQQLGFLSLIKSG